MKFTKNSRRKALEYEADWVKKWQANKTFEKSVEMRPKDNAYVFYDGPPFLTGKPHHGHILGSVIKDTVARYQTMKGKRVERVWGWDCHGLPAENFVERKLGIKDKREVGTTISLETYINTCHESMVQTSTEWEDTVYRIGRWVDFKGAYKTMDKEYMESVWWAFKTLYEKGKIYEGEKVLMYCVRCATPISKAEVAMDNSYQVVTDPSVYVKLKVVGDKGSNLFLLTWTTTPWTLNTNTAAAVNPDIEYSYVQIGAETFIVASDLVPKVFTDEKHQPLDYQVVKTVQGDSLVGLKYVPLFADRGENAHQVIAADYVTIETGTGVVHLSPAYGEEDYELVKKLGVPFFIDIDENGYYTEGPWKGSYFWDVNKQIAKELHEQGVVWKIEYFQHEYPHCHRCQTKLQYRAHPSWFFDIDSQRTEMLEQNQPITWFPEHIKHGRFENTVKSAPDWNLSRDRFWATAMPVWKGTDSDGNELIKVVGSYAELESLSGRRLDDYHRPWVDDITFDIQGVTYRRIDKVLDCWFESGSMPFAQFHYPFENVEKFEQNFPGDFIVEYVGQVRAWFYYMHAVSIGLFGKNAFKNVIVTGTVAGNDGRKMSKSFGNYTDPNELMDQFSADSLRYLLLSSPLVNGEDFSLLDKDVADVSRKLSMIGNMYDFFTLYADVDGWEYDGVLTDPLAGECDNLLDRWIVSRLHEVMKEVDTHMQSYDLQNALKPILPFVDDASNWYVRRSRKRFWKSDDQKDKNQAYKTLHYVLVQLSHVIAPFTPFLAEELYCQLTGDESVHLRDWPQAGHIDELATGRMARVRDVINTGLAMRSRAGVKVRQPLAKITLGDAYVDLTDEYKEIIKDELNIKEVVVRAHASVDPSKTVLEHVVENGLGGVIAGNVEIDTEITPELHREGLMREVIRMVQNSRKEAGLEVDDRINLHIESAGELEQAITEHIKTICEETLAVSIDKASPEMFKTDSKIEDHTISVHLSKS